MNKVWIILFKSSFFLNFHQSGSKLVSWSFKTPQNLILLKMYIYVFYLEHIFVSFTTFCQIFALNFYCMMLTFSVYCFIACCWYIAKLFMNLSAQTVTEINSSPYFFAVTETLESTQILERWSPWTVCQSFTP